MSKYSSILIFGCPGSGKGTQGVALGQMPNLIHLAMGDIFRALDKESDIGKEFLSYSTQGKLVPDELTVRVFKHHLGNMVQGRRLDPDYHTLILDGIPRTIQQVKLLQDVLDVKCILHLVIADREGLVTRLSNRAKSSGRPDDADRKVIENRLTVYENETLPVLNDYSKNLIRPIDADQHQLAVLRDIAAALTDIVPAL